MTKVFDAPAPIGNARFTVFEGVVTNHQTQRWSSTHVSASGGGGYVHPTYGGHVSTPQLQTTVHHHSRTDFWVRSDDGQERHFTIDIDRLPAVPGHRARFIYGAAVRKPNDAAILFAHNMTSGHYSWFERDGLWHWAREKGLIRYPLLYRLGVRGLPLILALAVLASVVVNWHSLGFATAREFAPSIGIPIAGFFILVIWGLLEWFGFLFFGCWWRKLALRGLKTEVSHLAGQPVPPGTTVKGWLISAALLAGLLYVVWRGLANMM